MTLRLASIVASGPVEPWTALGFTVEAERVALANGAVRMSGTGEGGLFGLEVDIDRELPVDLDGVPLSTGEVVPGGGHPNGAFELDHVVIRTPSLERTSQSITAALGLELKRIRETDTVRQGFHRFPDQGGVRGCIVEVVEDPRATSSSLWGLVVNVADLDAVVERLGPDLIGPAKPAVQAGRGIATVRRAAGIGVPLALMTPA